MSKITFQDKTFLQELAEIPEVNKVTDGNINSIKKAINENGQYVSATESNGKFTCTLEGSISQNDTIHILFDTNSTTEPASLSVDGGNIFLNILDASGNSINASELSGQSVSLKNAGSNFEVETLNSYSSSKTKSYSANYVNGLNTYSTTETVCGTWIDGKPIYRKVINCGSMPNYTAKFVNTDLNAANVNIIKIYGSARDTTGSTIPLPFFHLTSASGIMISFEANGTIGLQSNVDRSSFSGYIILEYTKTTD